MNHKIFNYRAVVDFVEIEVIFEQATQACHVSRLVRPALSVTALDPRTNEPFPAAQSNTNTTVFRVRVQDPTSHAHLMNWVQVFRERASQWAGPAVSDMQRITAIEIAFDVYAKPGKASRHDLARAVAYLYRTAPTVQGEKNHRLYREEGEGTGIPCDPESLARAFDGPEVTKGFNVGIGDKHADHYQHFYIKDTDSIVEPETGKTDRCTLPVAEHRARFENRWRGRELADLIGEHLTDLEGFKFASLAKDYCSFRRADPTVQGLAKALLKARRQIGERMSPEVLIRRHDGARRRKIPYVYLPGTRADAELNKHARNALERLTKAWARAA